MLCGGSRGGSASSQWEEMLVGASSEVHRLMPSPAVRSSREVADNPD